MEDLINTRFAPIGNHIGYFYLSIMKVFATACIVVVFCVAESLQYTPFTACTNGPEPKELRVEGCKSSPCDVFKGTELLAQWDFVANADAEKLSPRVIVTVMGIITNFPFPEKDACKSLINGECPLEKGDEATYNLRMPISKHYPPLNVKIEFSLIDENKNVQVCFNLNVKITKKNTQFSKMEKEK